MKKRKLKKIKSTTIPMLQLFNKYFNKYIGRNIEYYNWFLVNIVLHPHVVYDSCKYQFGLTQQWHRRDHAITKIVMLFNTILSFVFGITFVSPLFIIPYVFFDVLIPMVVGVVIAVIIYYLCKSSFTTGNMFTVRYSYDIHINAYLCYLLISHVVIFIFSPLLFTDSFISTLFSNTLICLSIIYYIYITYLGYSILPFIKVPFKACSIPMVFAIVLFMIFTLMGINIPLTLL